MFSREVMLAWAWRIPFMISILLILVGFYLRVSLLESPIFEKMLVKNKIFKFPLYQALKTDKLVMIKIFIFGMFVAIPYYSFNVFTTTYLTTFSHYSYNAALFVSLFSTIIYIIMLPFFGYLLDIIGRRKFVIFSSIGLIVFSYPVYVLINMLTDN